MSSAELLKKSRDLLQLLEILFLETYGQDKLEILDLSSPVLHASKDTVDFFLLVNAYFYVMNPTKSITFHAPSFYTDERADLMELDESYRRHPGKKYKAFHL